MYVSLSIYIYIYIYIRIYMYIYIYICIQREREREREIMYNVYRSPRLNLAAGVLMAFCWRHVYSRHV